ncbi:hypothetical protein [Ferribacterium limneticum]|uniref:hypothetical protein n=1 Tax=Ferribacterium limneticum TaxID=76259 RepID=UPI001CF84EEA|nr:hypothetical protein [Ferribacterium limneticum]UCV21186.1 hypothetical protein KI613_11505 [Ferribacterium limneticum]
MQVSNRPGIAQQPISDKHFPTCHFFLTSGLFPAAHAAKRPANCCQTNNAKHLKPGSPATPTGKSLFFHGLVATNEIT